MKIVDLKVNGMSCGHCVKAIEGSVGKLSGVANVKVDLQGARVSVQYNENEVTIDRIKETIDDQGYDVE
ncbi:MULTISPECIES: copper chaperone CopZ [unclassified Bacillus (in: firmicutes)]|uniref:copper chaperone CopZ n=1 Tax=unclassified Bacillus (in: firmicutes) TaxID=185979 RepID=UPI0008E724A9|nr:MULTISPECIES: copper chaperone CopZ [unclassified Bacillus (in: firmicutes)]SFB13313.1 copper chaperone [Bacillus sp. UNCCL13]SFQ90046.1 copper chaperone [Bacillus sp. cl95]